MDKPPMMDLGGRQLFLDVTDLRTYMIEHDSFTGIQRVVVMVLMEIIELTGTDQVFLSFFDIESGRYRTVSTAHLALFPGSIQEKFSAVLNVQSADEYIRPTLEKYRKRKVRRWFHTFWRDFNAFIGNKRYFRKRRSSIAEWQESKRIKSPKLAVHRDFYDSARPDDIVFLAGAAWFRESKTVFGKVTRSGVRIVSLIHDLIPIVTPQFVASQHPVLFHDWLLSTLGYVDLYIANSEATGRDMKGFLEVYDTRGDTDDRVAVVPLAQDKVPDHEPVTLDKLRSRIDRTAYPALYHGMAVSEHIRALTKRPYVLIVGTADIRKNLWSLTQAWARLTEHRELEVPTLVIAGREGAMNGDCRDYLAASGNLNGWVVRVVGPSDAELDYLYRNCLFTAMPSYYEGWGLPIGESLSYGKTAVVSETSSMPEVGGDYVEYCDPHSIESIYHACLKLIADPAHRADLEARIASADLRSWQDVARDMLLAMTAEGRTVDKETGPGRATWEHERAGRKPRTTAGVRR